MADEDLGSALVAPPKPKRVYITGKPETPPEAWSPNASPYVPPSATPQAAGLGEALSQSTLPPPAPDDQKMALGSSPEPRAWNFQPQQDETRPYQGAPIEELPYHIGRALETLGVPADKAYDRGKDIKSILGMVPGLSTSMGGAEVLEDVRKGNYGSAALGAATTALPAAAGPMVKGAVKKGAKAVKEAVDASKVASTGDKLAESTRGAVPAVAERYPLTVAPVEAFDPVKKKMFLQKENSPEAETVSKARIAAQRDIDKGNYTPYFDPAKRFDVDPSNYPDIASTLGQLSKRPKPENAAKYAAAQGPEAAARLDEAYQRGLLQKDAAGNWYHMGQLENEFIKEYGPEEGRRQFKEKFADAMAATTGGASPKDNLMMAHYGNYLRNKGLPLPEKSYDYPFPVGGRFAKSNMGVFQKMIMEGAGVTPANPKRYNFSGNYLGNRSGSTIDEQMMGLIEPGGSMSPPGGAYGHYEGPVAGRATAAGVDPRYYQEVAWAGAKDASTKGGYKAKPMIEIVNEAIERTHRITGMPKDEIVRRGLVRSEIPLYGLGATLGGLAAGKEMVSGEKDEPRS